MLLVLCLVTSLSGRDEFQGYTAGERAQGLAGQDIAPFQISSWQCVENSHPSGKLKEKSGNFSEMLMSGSTVATGFTSWVMLPSRSVAANVKDHSLVHDLCPHPKVSSKLDISSCLLPSEDRVRPPLPLLPED